MLNVRAKLITILIYALITIISIITLFISPVMGYELSIYEVYPPLFFLIIITFILSLYLCMYSIYVEFSKKYLFLGVFALIILEFILFMFPYIRGYAFYSRHDPLTHLGMIRDIIYTGYFGKNNFYPLFHIIIVNLIYVCGIFPSDSNLFFLRCLIPFVFFVLYVIMIFLITKISSNNNNYPGFFISLIFGIIIFNLNFSPSDNLFLFFPFFIYLYLLDQAKNNISTKILLVTILLFFPFGHPELVIFGILTLIIFEVTKYLMKKYKNKFEINYTINKHLNTNQLLILIVTFLFWYSTFTIFKNNMMRVISSFLEQVGPQPISGMLSTLSRSSISNYEFLDLLLKMYGAEIILLLLSMFLFIFAIKEGIKNNKINYLIVTIGLIIGLSLIFSLFSLFSDVLLPYSRIIKYPILFSTIFISIYLSNKYHIIKNNKKIFYGLIIILVTTFSLNLIDLYPSPITYTYNQQVSQNEINGADWLINNGIQLDTIDSFLIFGRYVNMRLGYDVSLEKNYKYATQTYQPKRTPPDHFNYTNNSYFGESYSEDTYFLKSGLVNLFYEKLFPENARFTKEDYMKLENDNSVQRIYDSENFNIYLIHSLNN